jgi:hypothetical protein
MEMQVQRLVGVGDTEVTLFSLLPHLCVCVGGDLRHQVLRPLLAYCTAPDDR